MGNQLRDVDSYYDQARELEEFKKLFDYEKLSKLLGMLDSVNPKVEAKIKGKEEPVLEL